MPRAASLAERLRQEFGFQSKLTPGNRGEFTVWLEGEQVAAKDHQGFPDENEIVSRIKNLAANGSVK